MLPLEGNNVIRILCCAALQLYKNFACEKITFSKIDYRSVYNLVNSHGQSNKIASPGIDTQTQTQTMWDGERERNYI